MDPQPDLIRQQIDETRSSLTEKLETLEAEVKGGVASAREAVEQTVTTVKQTFDIRYQMDHHPWFMLGLALVSGAVAGALVGGRMNGGRRMARRMAEVQEPPQPGFADKLADRLGDELGKVQELAISTLAGVISNVAQKAIPTLGHAVEEMLERAAADAGTTPPQYGPQI
jgi:hypothetical protein